MHDVAVIDDVQSGIQLLPDSRCDCLTHGGVEITRLTSRRVQ